MAIALLMVLASPAALAWDTHYADPDITLYGSDGFADDGSAFLVSRDSQSFVRMRRVTPAGTLAWDRELAIKSLFAGNVETNDSRACVSFLVSLTTGAPFSLSVVCVDRETGAQVLRVDNVAQNVRYVQPRVLQLSDDDTLSAFYTTGNILHRVAIGADGSLGADTTLAGPVGLLDGVRPAENGSVLAAGITEAYPYLDFYVISPTGTVSPAVTSNAETRDFEPTVAPDGSLFVLTTETFGDTIRTVAVKVNSDGTEAWRVTVRDEDSALFEPTFDADTVYFAISDLNTRNDGYPYVTAPHAVLALDYATGEVRWNVNVPKNRHAFYDMRVSADGSALVGVAQSAPNKLRVQSRSTATGEILFDNEYECGAFACAHGDSIVTADDTLRVIAVSDSNRYQVYSVASVTTTPSQYSVGQTGIRGAWNVGSDGQGIVFDFDPASRTLFAPWFTKSYAPPEQQTASVADLHWYTLQTTVPAPPPSTEDRSVGVTIYETRGGEFAAGASIAPHRVGEGTLQFFNCNEGTLLYDFDDGQNDGVSGIMRLTRLTPRTDACVDLSGTEPVLEPPQVPAQDASGFRSAFSGSWSQVGSGGQGMELVVIPGQSLSAAWFTFDRAGLSNDPKKHHWFTLLGSLAGTANATVSTIIYQNVGGSFDSRPSASNQAIGNATIRFTSCTTAEVSYAFNLAAVSFANARGTIAFEHLGGCIGGP